MTFTDALVWLLGFVVLIAGLMAFAWVGFKKLVEPHQPLPTSPIISYSADRRTRVRQKWLARRQRRLLKQMKEQGQSILATERDRNGRLVFPKTVQWGSDLRESRMNYESEQAAKAMRTVKKVIARA